MNDMACTSPAPLSVALGIDLGATTTGVLCIAARDGEDIAASGFGLAVSYSPDDLTIGMAERTARRHMRRGRQRRKLAKRLVRLLLEARKPRETAALDSSAWSTLNGLMNRRGFTYLSVEEQLQDLDLAVLEPFASELFGTNSSVEDWLASAQASPQDAAAALQAPVFEQLARANPRQKLKAISALVGPDLDRDTIKALAEAASQLHDALQRASTAEAAGHRARASYLQAIRSDLRTLDGGKALCAALAVSPDELSSVIGNIGNMPLKALRRYFHDPGKRRNKNLDPEALHQALTGWFTSWRFEGESEARRAVKQNNRKLWLAELERTGKTADALWDLLARMNPVTSIPPYESNNNRRPPICQSVVLDPAALDRKYGSGHPGWRTWAANVARHLPSDMVDAARRAAEHDARAIQKTCCAKDDWFAARLLQMLLERSRKLDDFRLRDLAEHHREGAVLSQTLQVARKNLEDALGNQHLTRFLDFAAEYYYEEAGRVRSGLWIARDDSLVRVCGVHPPRLAKVEDTLLARLIGPGATRARLEQFLDTAENIPFPADPRATEANAYKTWGLKVPQRRARKAKSILASIADLQKELGGRLREYAHDYEVLLRNPETLSAAKKALLPAWAPAWGLYRHAEALADAIGHALGHGEDTLRRYRNPYSMAQLHNILFTQRHGFASNCRGCLADNSWRSSMAAEGGQLASALPSDTTRPLDGMLARLLDAKARTIADAIAARLFPADGAPCKVRLTLLIEENRFEFNRQLGEAKNKSKRDRDALEKIATSRAAEDEAAWKDKRRRIIDDGCEVCAYTGNRLTTGNIEFDHIVSRAVTGDLRGYAFDAEANLIAVSRDGNRAKGRRDYTLDDLHDAYLRAVFGTADRNAIRKQIDSTVREWLAQKDNSAFHQLPRATRQAIRHGLFIPELRPDILRELDFQNRTRVNGTQRWFIRRLLHWLARAFGPEKEIDAAAWRIDARSVSELRRQLAEQESAAEIATPRFSKNANPQPVYSHIVDAAMSIAVAMGNPAVRTHLGQNPARDKTNLLEFHDLDRALTLLPERYAHKAVRRTPVFAKPDPANAPLFKDGLLGERFVPLMLDASGELFVGFSEDNRHRVGRPKRRDKRRDKQLELLRALWPVLRRPAEWGDTPDLDRLAAIAAGRPKGTVWLHVDRRKAFEHWDRHWRAPDATLNALRALHYITVKKPVRDAIENGNKVSPTRDKLLDKCKLTIGGPGTVVPKASLDLPAKAAWERLLADERIKKHLGKNRIKDARTKPKDDSKSGSTAWVDWDAIHAEHFPRQLDPARQHSKARNVYSLPIVGKASGGFRVRRKTPSGEIWQLLQVEGFAIEGFAPATGNDYPLGFDDGVFKVIGPLQHLAPVGDDIPAPIEDSVGLYDYVRVPVKSQPDSPIRGLEVAPGSKERRRVRVCLLAKWFLDQMDPRPADTFSLPAEVRLPKKNASKLGEIILKVTDLSGLGPRTDSDQSQKLVLVEADATTVTIEYMAEGKGNRSQG